MWTLDSFHNSYLLDTCALDCWSYSILGLHTLILFYTTFFFFFSFFFFRFSLFSMIKGDLAAVAVTITFGALLGKTSHHQLLIISFIEVILYSANRAIGTKIFHAVDAGSSMYVHTFGAFYGLAVSRILYKSKIVAHEKETSRYTSDLFATVGKWKNLGRYIMIQTNSIGQMY